MNCISPRLFAIYKPPGITSYDVIRKIKKIKPKSWGKIGHFGTLDPFAEGLLLIGVAGAARLNDYIHSGASKTYISTGIMGKKTPTGDTTVDFSEVDESDHLNTVISEFSVEYIQTELEKKFIGSYMQAPPAYSAAKFEGKPLHEWARQGIEIKKEAKLRHVHNLKVLDYSFPNLTIEFEVSSGTYIRTLFEDCAKHLGTLGVLDKLIRKSIGIMNYEGCIKVEELEGMGAESLLERSLGPEEVLKYEELHLDETLSRKFSNGMTLESEATNGLKWIFSELRILGLARNDDGVLKSEVVFPQITDA